MKFGWLVGGTLVGLAVMASPSLAGENLGGFLLVHVRDDLTYTTDTTNYAGLSGIECAGSFNCTPFDAAACATNKLNMVATSTKAVGETFLFWVLAGFPQEVCPKVTGVTFGVTYDQDKFIILASGLIGDFELTQNDPSSGEAWPHTGSSNAVTFNSPSYEKLQEVYWFAGYAYGGEATFALGPHRIQGGFFADSQLPAELDPIEQYGTVGAGGAAGVIPDRWTATDKRTWGKIKTIFGR